MSGVIGSRHGHRLAIVAHRGGARVTGVPDPTVRSESTVRWENTVPAFVAARARGADGVELDVRRSADGAVVVVHDAVLDDGAVVGELEQGQLPAWLPTLEEALDACGAMLVDIEIKNAPTEPGFDAEQRVAHAVMATLARRGAQADRARWIVTSFWPDTLTALGEARARWWPEVPGGTSAPPGPRIGLLVHQSIDPSDLLERTKSLGCEVLLPWWERVADGWVAEAHRGGLQVMAWTVNGTAALDVVVPAGVDAVVTDDVDGALAFRRHWETSSPDR